MTGVGKTELVKAIVESLDLKDDFSSFDCGELDWKGSESIKNVLSNFSESKSPNPPIFLFDEFQFARSISSDGEEINFPESRALWQLLDNGTLTIHPAWYYHDRRVKDLIIESIKRVYGVTVKTSN